MLLSVLQFILLTANWANGLKHRAIVKKEKKREKKTVREILPWPQNNIWLPSLKNASPALIGLHVYTIYKPDTQIQSRNL